MLCLVNIEERLHITMLLDFNVPSFHDFLDLSFYLGISPIYSMCT